MLTQEFFHVMWGNLCFMYNKETLPALETMYWNCLKNELNDEELAACISLHLKNRDYGAFFPKPSDILRYKEITAKTKALEAWELITGDGYDRQKAKQDPIINKAMRMIGGWNNFAMVKIDDLPYRSRDFCEAYVLLCEKNEREEVFNDTKALANILKQVEAQKKLN